MANAQFLVLIVFKNVCAQRLFLLVHGFTRFYDLSLSCQGSWLGDFPPNHQTGEILSETTLRVHSTVLGLAKRRNLSAQKITSKMGVICQIASSAAYFFFGRLFCFLVWTLILFPSAPQLFKFCCRCDNWCSDAWTHKPCCHDSEVRIIEPLKDSMSLCLFVTLTGIESQNSYSWGRIVLRSRKKE